MKTVFLIFTLLIALATLNATAGLPPTNLSGQSQTVRPTTFTFKTPSRQATQTSGIESLIETGNLNILANPSYEHQTTASGWASSVTSTAVATYGTAATSLGELGLREATFSCVGGASGGVCTFFQDVRTSKVLQGLALMYASTTNAASTRFTSRVNNAKNQEVLFQGNSEALYRLPVMLGTTSTGLGVEITAGIGETITGTMDAAFVGVGDLKVDTNVVGPWISYTPSFTGLGTVASSEVEYRQVGSSIEIRGSFVSGVSTAVAASVTLPNPYTVKHSTATAQLDGEWARSAATGSSIKRGRIRDTNAENVFYFTWDDYTGASSPATAITGSSFVFSGERVYVKASIPVTQLSNSAATYSSTNADTDWASCGHTTSDFTGFGTVSAIETQCKRQGGDLLMKGNFTSGIPTSVEARLALRFNGVALTSKTSATLPSIQVAGKANNFNISTTTHFSGLTTLIEPSMAHVTFGRESSTQSGLAKRLASETISASGDRIAMSVARTPISGWENSNVIIGSFSETPTTRGSNGSDIQSVYFAGPANEGAQCSTGTCTIYTRTGTRITSVTWHAAGQYRLNGIDGTKYICSGTGVGAAYNIAFHDKTTSTSTYALIQFGSGGSGANSAYNSIHCIGIP